MRVTVVGKKKLQGQSKRTGQELNGTIIYFEAITPRVEGMFCDSTLVMSNLMPYNDIKIGKDLMLDFDKTGYLTGVSLL